MHRILAARGDAENIVVRAKLDGLHVDSGVLPGKRVDPCTSKVESAREKRWRGGGNEMEKENERRTSAEFAVNRVIDVGNSPVYLSEVEAAELCLRLNGDAERVAPVARARVATTNRLVRRRRPSAREGGADTEGEVGNGILCRVNLGREEHWRRRGGNGVAGITLVELLSLRRVDVAGGVERDVVGDSNDPLREDEGVAAVERLDRGEAVLNVLAPRDMKVDVVESELCRRARKQLVSSRTAEKGSDQPSATRRSCEKSKSARCLGEE